jgi:two-component system sensor histidine kinase DesK
MPITGAITTRRNPNWAWIWLAYSGFLFLEPIFEPSRIMWVGTLAVFAAFIGIFMVYFRACDAGSVLRFWMIAATFALGLIAFPWNQGASCLFVYAAGFLPFTIISIRRIFALFALQVLLVLAEGCYFTIHVRHGYFHVGWPNTLVAIFLMVVIGGGNIFFAEQQRSERQLQAAQEENFALAAVAERERIARDLHDVLGHTLSVIVLKAELAGRLLRDSAAPDTTRAAAEIGDVERTARTALAEVREAIGGYRARGLGAEIEAARRTLDAAGVTLVVDSASGNGSGPPSNAGLSPQEETVLALALREAVTNIVRHANATTCTLRFGTEGGHHRLVISDDGQASELREGNGLRGMRERVESVGGQLAMESSGGTRLQISLPLHAEAAVS